MKRYLSFGFCLLLALSLHRCVGAQPKGDQSKFLCDCSAIGIATSWADSNGVSCYLIPVHRSQASADSSLFSLAVVVAKAVSASDETPLLYLHGGPGIATLDNVKRYMANPTWKLLRQDRDLVFFDYRGTGHSEPELCNMLSDSLEAFRHVHPDTEQQTEKEISLYKSCRESLMANGVNLSDFTSLQLAADAEAIRNSLGIESWNLYGVSYGTTVALNMIRSFPTHVKSVILDSPFPPNAPWLDFVRPFDTCFTILEHTIMQDPFLSKQFPSIRKDFVQAVSRLNEKPAQLTDTINGEVRPKPYYGDEFAWSIWSAMLSPKTIPFVPLAIREVGHGNDAILQLWSTAFSSPDKFGKFSEPQSHAILCYEAKPQSEGDSEASLRVQYPDFTSFISAYNTRLCEAWRPEVPDKAIFAPVSSDIPVLILSGEFDPVCPPVFGDITAQTLSNAVHIVVPSASHAAIHADDCLRMVARDFLSDPQVKPSNACMNERRKIEFVTKDLGEALQKTKI